MHATHRGAQDNGDFSQAFWMCAQSCQWMSELGQVHVAQPLTASVNGLYEETTRWLEGAMQSLCADFKPDRVSKASAKHIFSFLTEVLGRYEELF